MVKTIEHESSDLILGSGGSEFWDLLSDNGMRIASGMYFYHVESNAGDQIGKFGIVQ